MTYFRPCKNCVREKLPCMKRDQVRAALKGACITSVAFRCDERLPIYAVGQRVTVSWSINVGCDSEYPDWNLESWPATVVAERGTKFQILVDDVDSDFETPARSWIKNDSLYAKVTVPRLKPLDEPDRDVCSVCQGVRQSDGSVIGCFGRQPAPGGCIA